MSNGLYVPNREGPNWAALKQMEERRETGRGEQVKEKIRKQELIDKIKMAVLEKQLEGKIRPREGMDLEGLDYGGDIGKVSGRLGEYYEPVKDVGKEELLGIMGGVKPPEDYFSEKELEPITPRVMGEAMGGKVLSQPGAKFKGGRITSPIGEDIGTYAPGFEPGKFKQARPAVMRERMGIGKEEAGRKFLGMPKKEGRPVNEEEYNQNLRGAVSAIDEGKDPNEVYKMMVVEYPSRSAELRRILIMGEEDIDLAAELETLRK